MKRFLGFLALLLVAVAPVLAQSQLSTLGVGVGHVSAGGGFTPSCSQSTAFLARTSGLDNTHQTAYDGLICGLVGDGVWAKFDALWITGAPDSTTATLNLVSSSFTLTPVSSPTFSANNGFTGSAAPAYLGTNFTPSTDGVTYQQDSAHFSFDDCTSRGTETSIQFGGQDGGANHATLLESQLGGNAQLAINMPSGSGISAANANAQGLWVGTRTSSTAIALYKNATSFLTGSIGSTTPPPVALSILAFGAGQFGTGDQVFEASVGGAVTGTDVTDLNSRLATFKTAVGSSCP